MRHHQGWRRRDVLRGAGLLGLSSIGLSSRAATNEPLNSIYVGGSVTPVFEQLMQSGNYFQQFGVETNIVSVADGSKVIAALISGNSDLCGGSGFSGVFPAIEKGAQIKIIAGTMLHPQNAVVSKRPDILSSKDLIGKTIGVKSFQATAIVWMACWYSVPVASSFSSMSARCSSSVTVIRLRARKSDSSRAMVVRA